MPMEYFYIDGAPLKFISSGASTIPTEYGPYILDKQDIPNLQAFIKNTALPFKQPYLELAFENFELSYDVHDASLAFLSLMISLETLFNPGGSEIRYRLSRNVAVLLGQDRESAKKIFSITKILYDKRSKLVHSGDKLIIKQKDLFDLRQIVRESIKTISRNKLSKESLMDALNTYGFGEMSAH
jgi:hypothetical protein